MVACANTRRIDVAEPRIPRHLKEKELDFLTALRVVFKLEGRFVEAYITCVLIGLIPNLDQLSSDEQDLIRKIAQRHDIELP